MGGLSQCLCWCERVEREIINDYWIGLDIQVNNYKLSIKKRVWNLEGKKNMFKMIIFLIQLNLRVRKMKYDQNNKIILTEGNYYLVILCILLLYFLVCFLGKLK